MFYLKIIKSINYTIAVKNVDEILNDIIFIAWAKVWKSANYW